MPAPNKFVNLILSRLPSPPNIPFGKSKNSLGSAANSFAPNCARIYASNICPSTASPPTRFLTAGFQVPAGDFVFPANAAIIFVICWSNIPPNFSLDSLPIPNVAGLPNSLTPMSLPGVAMSAPLTNPPLPLPGDTTPKPDAANIGPSAFGPRPISFAPSIFALKLTPLQGFVAPGFIPSCCNCAGLSLPSNRLMNCCLLAPGVFLKSRFAELFVLPVAIAIGSLPSVLPIFKLTLFAMA